MILNYYNLLMTVLPMKCHKLNENKQCEKMIFTSHKVTILPSSSFSFSSSCWGLKIISFTSVLHCCLSLTNHKHSTTVLLDQSLTLSVHRLLVRPAFHFQWILPSRCSAILPPRCDIARMPSWHIYWTKTKTKHKFLAQITWLKYCSLHLCTLVIIQ